MASALATVLAWSLPLLAVAASLGAATAVSGAALRFGFLGVAGAVSAFTAAAAVAGITTAARAVHAHRRAGRDLRRHTDAARLELAAAWPPGAGHLTRLVASLRPALEANALPVVALARNADAARLYARLGLTPTHPGGVVLRADPPPDRGARPGDVSHVTPSRPAGDMTADREPGAERAEPPDLGPGGARGRPEPSPPDPTPPPRPSRGADRTTPPPATRRPPVGRPPPEQPGGPEPDGLSGPGPVR